METLKIRKNVCVEPLLVNKKINDNLRDKITTLYLGTCTHKNGYVIEIAHDIVIRGNRVADNGSVIFDVEFSVKTLKPQKGQILEGEICMIFEDGIFVEVGGKMKVLIPTSRIEGMEFDRATSSFTGKERSVHMSDVVNVKIDQIRYEKCQFSCIGFLV